MIMMLDDVKNEDGTSCDPTDQKKKRPRRLGKIGVGGFTVKVRGRSNKEEDGDKIDTPIVAGGVSNPLSDLTFEGTESGTAVASDKPKRRRRAKKKVQLSDTFPVYMQEAFFGKSLMDTTKELAASQESLLGRRKSIELTSEDDELSTRRRVSSDKMVCLGSSELSSAKSISEPRRSIDSYGALDDDDLSAFKDLLPLGQDLTHEEELLLMHMQMDDSDGGDHSRADGKEDDAIVSQLLNSPLDIDMPHMDSQDVDDLFNGVLSPAAGEPLNGIHLNLSSGSDHPVAGPGLLRRDEEHLMNPFQPSSQQLLTIQQPNQQQQQLSHSQQMFSHQEGLPPMSASIGRTVVDQAAASGSSQWSDSDSNEQTQSQKNLEKWKVDEILGEMATISPVLYANMAFPNLRLEHPVWSERIKQITKLWRQLNTNDRQPFLQKARENRAASRISKAQETKPPAAKSQEQKAVDSESEKQWKQIQANRQLQLQQPLRIPSSDASAGGGGEEQSLVGFDGLQQRMLPPGQLPQGKSMPSVALSTATGPSARVRPPLDPLRMPVPAPDLYSTAPGTPRPPQPPTGVPRPVNRFSPGVSSQSPGPLTPGSAGPSDRMFQSTPPAPSPRPLSRESFGEQGTGSAVQQQSPQHQSASQSQAHPVSPFAPQQPQTPVPTSPFPGSPAGLQSAPADAFAPSAPRTPTPGQQTPQSPFSPNRANSENRFSPAPRVLSRQESFPCQQSQSGPGTPSSDGGESSFTRPSSSEFAHPQVPCSPSTPTTPTPQSDPYSSMPMTPRPAPGSFENDLYARPPLTPRPAGPGDGFARPNRPVAQQHGYYQYPQNQMRPPQPGAPFRVGQGVRPPLSPSDPYAQQPGTPMPSHSSSDPYANPPRTPMPTSFSDSEAGDGSGRDKLRDLLQRQPSGGTMRPDGYWGDPSRPRMPIPQNMMRARAVPVSDGGFRSPLPPAVRQRHPGPQMPVGPPPPGSQQPQPQQMFRHPADGVPRQILHRHPQDPRIRMGGPPQHMMQQRHPGPGPGMPPGPQVPASQMAPQQQQQQPQWNRMPMHQQQQFQQRPLNPQQAYPHQMGHPQQMQRMPYQMAPGQQMRHLLPPGHHPQQQQFHHMHQSSSSSRNSCDKFRTQTTL